MGEHKQPRTQLRAIHRLSSNHRELIAKSSLCGCFYCEKMFKPPEIRAWVDRSDPVESDGLGQTALCPYCGIDSVIPDSAGSDLTPDLLARMKTNYFGNK